VRLRTSATRERPTPAPRQTPRVPPRAGRVVGIVGLGYVGLPTALAFLAAGSQVVGFDVCPDRRRRIQAGDVDLVDADRDRLRQFNGGSAFTVTDEPGPLADTDTVIICVPTPVDDRHTPDLRAIRAACATVVRHAVPGQLLLLTSTTYVGTTRDLLVNALAARGLTVGVDVFVAFSPERIDPGSAEHRQEDTPRVVGGVTPACLRRAAQAVGRIAPSVHEVSSVDTAEMSKLLENTFRAVNIALANEVADLCRDFGLSAGEVIDAASTKPYGFMPFHPGPGVGGHCIPCDPHYLLWQPDRHRVRAPLIEQAMSCNDARPARVVERAAEVLGDAGRGLAGARVLVLGVSYKPNVADVRASPALRIMADLLDRDARVEYVDPLVPRVVLAGGRTRRALARPGDFAPDLVIILTHAKEFDLSWVRDGTPVLDATYRAHDLPNLVVL
jgi:UDP-N-acetyl-D-glucosamine dehydrogenase